MFWGGGGVGVEGNPLFKFHHILFQISFVVKMSLNSRLL